MRFKGLLANYSYFLRELPNKKGLLPEWYDYEVSVLTKLHWE